MSILFIFIVAIGMAMDGFVVSLTQGMSLDKKKLVLSSIKIGGGYRIISWNNASRRLIIRRMFSILCFSLWTLDRIWNLDVIRFGHV